MPCAAATRRRISSNASSVIGPMNTLLWMRRKNASSPRAAGSRLVENTTLHVERDLELHAVFSDR